MPDGALAVRPVPVCLVLALSYGASLPLAAFLAGGPGAGWRGLLAAASLAISVSALVQGLCLRGAGAVRQLRWDAQGGFAVDLAGGYSDAVTLHPASLGSAGFLWLVLQGRRRYYVFLGRRQSDPIAFSSLRRRLLLRPSAPRPMG